MTDPIRGVTRSLQIELSAEVVLEVVVFVAESDIVVPPPRPRPKARMILQIEDEAGGIREIDVACHRLVRGGG